ncbi:MAG: G5 domain-containing protein [Bifidobacterium sp.]|nr:G5 domain-containing protein [Bifidobacterium sp.]
MSKRWTPQRFVTLRRVRVIICVVAVVLASCLTFGITQRKAVALTVNGETRHVTTYAASVSGLLREQGIDVKSHDLVKSGHPGGLVNNDTVTVQSAYQATITIDGQEVPFWTVATSADQLIGFFEANQVKANRITVDIKNVYNQLTGGLVINEDGPVTVIADGKTSVAPNGKLPAASILDSKSIVLGKDDRVTVSKQDGKTILRVQRVKYGEETVTETIPFTTREIVDDSLQPGERKVERAGVDGEKTITYKVTYVDGVAESRTETGESVTRTAIDEVVAVGPAKAETKSDTSADTGTTTSGQSADSASGGSAGDATTSGGASSADTSKSDGNDSSAATKDDTSAKDDQQASPEPSSEPSSSASASAEPTQSASQSKEPSSEPSATPTQTPTQTPKPTPTQTQTPKPTPTQTQTPTPTPTPTQTQAPATDTSTSGASASNCRLYHPSAAAAQAYAAGAAAQYGWTGQNWTDLVKLWNRESGWQWNAENRGSGAYGIPQSLPGNKMAAFGANWKDDAAVQIDWGLSYISGCYGTPSKAWQHSEQTGWY